MTTSNQAGYQAYSSRAGAYYEPGKRADNYAGIITALQENIVSGGGLLKSYPENFAGIIEAIRDLRLGEYQPGSDSGNLPPGDSIDNSDPDNPIYVPGLHVNGQLWFDTRQGRLFVYIDGDWVQTNGADGLPVLLPQTPVGDAVVPGQLWWHTLEEKLYIFSGTWIDTDGELVAAKNVTSDHTPVWKPIEGVGGGSQTTATLPLIATITEEPSVQALPSIDMSSMSNQNDYNEWLYDALVSLDSELADISAVEVGETAPDTPAVGQLWYDTSSLDMSIWYDDGQSQQWVPISVVYSYDEDIANLTNQIRIERSERKAKLAELAQRITDFDLADNNQIVKLQQDINAINHRINVLPTYDLSGLASKQDVLADIQNVINQIDGVRNTLPDLNDYQTKVEAGADYQSIQDDLGLKASIADLNDVENLIPDVSSFVTAADIQQAIANISTDFLPKTGGRLSGSFVLSKSDTTAAGLDFSETASNGKNAFKFATYSPGSSNTLTFGTTSNLWECAWKFAAEEDFCWIYNDTDKVFSISKDGPACSTLYLGDFAPNSTNGRTLLNTIDLRERLTTYQSALEDIRRNVTAATDFNSLKSGIVSALASI